ncbi:MAG: BrnA antitoxin family protein [Amaricoccus sp.]
MSGPTGPGGGANANDPHANPEEDAEITASALADPDNPPWTPADFARAKRGRLPMLAAKRKRQVTISLDPAVVEAAKAGGPGWQTRINAVLRQHFGLSDDAA